MMTDQIGCTECGGSIPGTTAIRAATLSHGCPFCGAAVSEDELVDERRKEAG